MPSPEQIDLTTSGLSAAVSLHGAQLISLKTAEGQELLWQGDPRYWADRAPILFPLIGPVVDGQIHHGEHCYPMPPHGFARDRDFAISQQTPKSCLLELRDDRETRSHYPFAFTLRVEFELSDDSLHGTIAVENPNEESVPADVGFHPGFNWPLTSGQAKEEDFAIVFAEDEPAPVRRGVQDPILLIGGSALRCSLTASFTKHSRMLWIDLPASYTDKVLVVLGLVECDTAWYENPR